MRKLADIPYDKTGIFIKRPNRFLALVNLDGNDEPVHVRDPGRLEELLFPGNRVMVSKAANPDRKTGWDLVAAEFENRWILVNSGKHREIATRLIAGGFIIPSEQIEKTRPEVKYGKSRLDFRLDLKDGQKLWIEVKGCTLAQQGIALFPDAPTLRGTRHLNELVEIRQKGMRAAMVILIFRDDAKVFAPYGRRDPLFADAFYKAVASGVEAYPVSLSFKNGAVNFNRLIPIQKQNSRQ
jgi:sugar fermentation stimulation protein A